MVRPMMVPRYKALSARRLRLRLCSVVSWGGGPIDAIWLWRSLRAGGCARVQ